ncbi:MAG: amidase, Asp-tRNAAsn/Glu-tRNAGln amidotransferase subunit [Solirubrobacterales bacterium]|nr:amidase, Asp-tRNAAsn/Glu-tRNAGln amidotransferase subunit [Solirubrobacterales bacterium]
MDAAELMFAGIGQQARMVRDGEVSPTELVQACLDRIAALDPQLNAFRIVLAEKALAEAAQAEGRRGAGDSRPLLGVPIAIKDDVDVAGTTTAWGTAAHGPEKSEDALLVRRLREAGAIIVGKTNVPEMTIWPFTESPTFGPTRNPWDTGRTTGGSSGGTGAAVASGMVGAGSGSDGGGSIRIPSAWCGLFGLKTTRGLVPLEPHDDAWQGLSVNGVLTRSVSDSALFLTATTGQAFSAEPLAEKLTIAVAFNRLPGAAPWPKLDPDIRTATLAMAELLRSLGHTVVEREPSFGAGAFPHFLARYTKGIQDDVATMAHPDRLEKRTLGMRRMGALWPASRVAAMRRGEAKLRDRIWDSLGGADVLMTPTVATLPPPVGKWQGKGAFATLNGIAGHVPYNAIYNATGQPAAAVPSGLSASGMPLSVQLIGPLGADARLLSLSAQIEAAQPWADRRPPVS